MVYLHLNLKIYGSHLALFNLKNNTYKGECLGELEIYGKSVVLTTESCCESKTALKKSSLKP